MSRFVSTHALLSNICWCLFLIFVLLLPIPFGAFDGFYWSLFAAIAAILFALYAVTQIAQPSINLQALYHARYVLIFMLLQMIYVFWQMLASGDHWTLSGTDSSFRPQWLMPLDSHSIQPGAASTWLAKQALVLLVFVWAMALLNTRKRVRWLVYVIIGSAVMHAMIGLMAKYSGLHLVPTSELDGHFGESRGLFVNRNHFAAMINYGMAMLAVAGFYHLYTRLPQANWRQRFLSYIDGLLSPKLLWLSVFVILLIAINFSTSRAALFGLVSSLVAVTALAVMVDHQLKLALKLYIALLVLVALVVIVGGASGLLARLQDGLFSIGERTQQWSMTIELIQQYWLWGTGAGTYSDVFQLHREYGQLRQTAYDQAHSIYLQTFLEQGLIGFSLWIAGFAAIVWQLVRGFIRNCRRDQSRYIRSTLLASLFGVLMALVQAMVDFNLLLPALNVYFYCIVAIGIAAISVDRSKASMIK